MSLTSKYILSELGSPGKSGSFFYFSRDYKYIIKTIHHAEHKLLRRVLRQYYEHVEHNPNTLISQFYGLHRVKMAYGRKIHFVVMNNLFPPHRDIHQMFDLKGSTVGRNFNEDDLEHNPRATLKDLNWLRHNRRLHCGPQKKEIFMAQLKRDVGLLQSLNIMDYSLLVGVHDMTKGNDEKVRDKTLQVFQPGSANGEDPTSQNLIRTPSRVEYLRKAREFREMIQRERPVPLEQTSANLPDEILDRRNNMIFYSDDGGFRATHEDGQAGNEIYYIGVIDCLTNVCVYISDRKNTNNSSMVLLRRRKIFGRACLMTATRFHRYLPSLMVNGLSPSLRALPSLPKNANAKKRSVGEPETTVIDTIRWNMTRAKAEPENQLNTL